MLRSPPPSQLVCMVLFFVSLSIIFEWMNKQLVCQIDNIYLKFLSICIISKYFSWWFLKPIFKADKFWREPNIVLYLTKFVRSALGWFPSFSLLDAEAVFPKAGIDSIGRLLKNFIQSWCILSIYTKGWDVFLVRPILAAIQFTRLQSLRIPIFAGMICNHAGQPRIADIRHSFSSF